MTLDLEHRIPFLTVGERAELFGTSYLEQLALEKAQPWVRHWTARFEDGAASMRAWLVAGRPIANRADLHIVGDPEIVAVVRAVLAELPEAAAWHVVKNVIVKCGGDACDNPIPRAIGWRREAPPGSAKPLEIGILVADRQTFAHEAAHAWQLAPSLALESLDAEQRLAFASFIYAEAVDAGTDDELIEKQMQRERAADGLASLWLGERVDTTSGVRGERRRHGLRQEIDLRAANHRGRNDG